MIHNRVAAPYQYTLFRLARVFGLQGEELSTKCSLQLSVLSSPLITADLLHK